MKHLVLKENEINIDELRGDELIAYKCKSDKESYAVLCKIWHGNYGFLALNNSDSNPRYVGQTWISAIKLAAKNRDLKVFYSMQEMLEAMVNKEF